MIVKLDDMRGTLDQCVEVSSDEWAALAAAAGETPDTRELDASCMADTTLFDRLLSRAFDRLLSRAEVDPPADATIWVP